MSGLKAVLGDRIAGIGLEYGTLPVRQVMAALIAERWLHYHGDRNTKTGQEISATMRAAFYPDSEEWRTAITTTARLVVQQVLDHVGGRTMLWAVDKKIVRHVLERDGQLVEIPIRVTFEYAIEDGTLVDDTLSLKTLFNAAAVLKRFPNLDETELHDEIDANVRREINEHLALAGYTSPDT
jgi:hypothetical protein